MRIVGNNSAPNARATQFSRLTRWRRRSLAAVWSWGEVALVMSVGAAQEWHSIEHVLLEPLQPKINDRGNEESDHLGKNKTANDDEAKWPARRGIASKTDRERDRAH